MSKRRTPEEVRINEKICEEFYNEYFDGSLSADGVDWYELKHAGWKGSAPYTVPYSFGKYMIKQLPAIRGEMYRRYSIVKIG